MNKQIWNFVQRSRGILQLQPLGCLCNQSQLFCSGCEPGQYQECEVCGYLQPWCKGAEDSFFQICDRCRDVVEQIQGAVEIPMEVEKLKHELPY